MQNERINTILFPTDFTQDAQKAYQYALEIAKKTGADLHFFHAVEEPYDYAARIEEYVEDRKNHAYEQFQQMQDEARESKYYREVSIYSEIRRGQALTAILDKAGAIKADLIIVGTKGESSLKRILYGNVTSRLILESDIPVCTIPANSKKPYLDRFIFTSDFRDDDLKSLERTINSLARPLDAEVHIVHVSTSNSLKSQSKFRGFCDLAKETIDYPKIKFERIVSTNFTSGITSYLGDEPTSLVVITRYKKKYLKTMIWASNTQELTYHTRVPLLVNPPESD
jgi:nucleotide-binding universal stress UspA family protein